LGPPEKSKSTQVRKGGTKRIELHDLESQIAKITQARDAAQKQAVDLHSEFQKLSQRAAEFEAQIGELDEQLKKARADAGKAEKKAAELERKVQDLSSRPPAAGEDAAALRKQLEQAVSAREASERELADARRKMTESQGELKKLQEERDRSKADSGKARLRAADLERRVQEVSAQGRDRPRAGRRPGFRAGRLAEGAPGRSRRATGRTRRGQDPDRRRSHGNPGAAEAAGGRRR
jgi:chromosome segregation ATPase